ncbi:PD-(D/E)XK nuclease family protein [Robertkochia sediminum]|uniref:PD-(D/E)XK nuclease family protein n=1 Tax=Robertkochia sediminum TaxID=2785326 RepID=UPI001931531B|nr:PD-(D/E)XK nuclease family protein [Robertkochia sediminum]MBL7471308.1 PD-(D/E)XK nuclease family protein [Robertkochia sediminum]
MKSFLSAIITELYSRHANEMHKLVLVLPSKRAGAFLRKELRTVITRTTFMPEIYSIEDFVQEISSLEQASGLHLLFEFYKTYEQCTPEEKREPLNEFTSWAQTAIQDFNEIDRYLIDPDRIFDHLFSIKELDHWTQTEPQTEIQKNYLDFWRQLKQLYHTFRENLSAKNLGYQGMIYREASEQVEYYLQAHPDRPHYFLGFNALNSAESTIIQEILANSPGEVYWDTDRHFMDDPDHDASLFLRRIKEEWPHIQKNGFKYIGDHYSAPKNIELIGVPGNIQQAKYMGNLIDKLKEQPGLLERTAVVLGQEALLPALLNAIPEGVEHINITSGFPLQYTPFASFFETLIHSWSRSGSNKWYYRDIDRILSHPACRGLFSPQGIDTLLKTMGSQNLIYLEAEQLYALMQEEHERETLKKLFPKNLHHTGALIEYCVSLLLQLRDHYATQEHRNPVFLQYLYRFYQLFNQLQHIQGTYRSLNNIKALLQVYRDLLVKETVDFKGEPLSGLQVMGMLESRNLDFETVIISSVNEGVLPGGKQHNSFIPFDLKLQYGLPTYKEKDAVYTYHFYRLLQRAKNVYIIYNTATDSLDGGEKSRFVQQLLLERLPGHQIKEVLASPQIDSPQILPASISKSPSLNERLRQVAAEGFSPSSLTNFIRNPIDFYKQRVLGIRELDLVEETVAANTMGTIVHDSLEALYIPFIGKYLTSDDLKAIRKRMKEVVTEKFSEYYSDPATVRGQNLISYHIAEKYVEKYLDHEQKRLDKGTSVRIIALEEKAPCDLQIPGLDFKVRIKGMVDRIEEVDGVWTVVDYKTGAVQPSELKVYDWDLMLEDYKYSKAFQVLCYVYMMRHKIPANARVQAGIVSLKTIRNGFMPFAQTEKPGARSADPEITPEVLETFEEKLFELIRTICDPAQPFVEKEIKTYDH